MSASRHRTSAVAALTAALLTAAVVLAGCTSGGADPATAVPSSGAVPGTGQSGTGPSGTGPTGTGPSGTDPTGGGGATGGVAPSEGSTDGSTTASAVTTTSLVPLTPDGLRTGPGVQTDHIALGLIVDPAVDRGFADGVRLWQSTVNRTTGICGRRIELTVRTASGVDATLTSYRELGPMTLGLLTQTAPAVQSELATHIADDEIPVVTPTGRSADLSSWGPMVVGATDDILAINAESYLMQTGALASGGQLGVLSDGSAAATEAEAGLRWFAERSGVTLRTFATTGTADWSGVSAVMVLAGPDQTSQVLAATGPGIPVVTTMAGDQVSSLDPAQHGRLLVSTPTTALDSDNPAAQAVVTAYAAGGGTDPGPLLFAGWASGATWGRLLQQACSQADLTRSGIRTAATDLPPAPTDSLLGATDLRAIVNDGLPATRVSAMSAVDPNAVGGLTALTWLQAAPGITDYVPAG